MIAALLVFAWLPLSHAPRTDRPPEQPDRAFFVAEMRHLIRQDQLAFQPRETATPVLDDAGTRMYVGTSDGFVRCLFRGKLAWLWRAGGSILAAPLVLADRDVLYEHLVIRHCEVAVQQLHPEPLKLVVLAKNCPKLPKTLEIGLADRFDFVDMRMLVRGRHRFGSPS